MSLLTLTVKEDDTAGATIASVTADLRTTADAFLDRQVTNEQGVAYFTVSDGTYRIYLTKLGVPILFTRPETVVVSGDTPKELYGIPIAPVAPATPGTAVVYDYLYNLGLAVRPGVLVLAKVASPSKVFLASGPILSGELKAATNAQGYFQFQLPKQSELLTAEVRYAIEIPSVGFRAEFDAEDLDVGGAVILSAIAE